MMTSAYLSARQHTCIVEISIDATINLEQQPPFSTGTSMTWLKRSMNASLPVFSKQVYSMEHVERWGGRGRERGEAREF